MKRILLAPGYLFRFTVALIAIVFFCSTALSASSSQSQNEKKLVLGLLVGISGLGDESFNDMTYAGLKRVQQEQNLKLIFEDSKKSDEAFKQSMQRLLEKGAQIIVANGFYLKDLVAEVAPQYPDRFFILQDAVLPELPNVASILYSVHEGSFLAGAMAGLMTKSGRVGFLGGVDIPIMHVFRQGYAEGVQYVTPKVQVVSEFVSKAPDFSGFKDPGKGYEMAKKQYLTGVDIIFAAAGLTGNGVIQAARKKGTYVIGVDSDQDHLAKGTILTSMMKRLDVATYKEVSEIIAGNFEPGVKIYGLKEQGVGLTPLTYTKDIIPQEVIERLSELEQLIKKGKITVTNYLEMTKPQRKGDTQ